MNKEVEIPRPEGRVDVCIAVMPYVVLSHPSIAAGILKACLSSAGLNPWVVYGNLLFARETGFHTACMMTLIAPMHLVGEWIFSTSAFPEHDRENEARIRNLAAMLAGYREYHSEKLNDEESIVEEIRRVKRIAPSFVDSMAASIMRSGPRIVACSSTFTQHVASLALLRKIKELDPSVMTLIGGANCECEMGFATVREFPWIDMAFSGEADDAFAALCRIMMEKGPDVDAAILPPGAINRQLASEITRKQVSVMRECRAVVDDLDSIPAPDYDEYFETLGTLPFQDRIVPDLPMEASRGCWWSVRGSCSFCALNGSARTFRAKSPERALAQIDAIHDRYGINGIEMVDNIIAPEFFETLLPALGSGGRKYDVFFQTKANLKREQVRTLARAGALWLQPGIESLHSSLLKLMNKGATAMINLQMLKYAREFGIRVIWNLLTGFPGEKDEWHFETASWLPLVYHLPPPYGFVSLSYERFTVYHQNPEKFDISLCPDGAYAMAYPLSDTALDDLAYFMIDSAKPGPFNRNSSRTPGITELEKRFKEWMHATYFAAIPAVLCMEDRAGVIEFYDTRPCAVERKSSIDGLCASVYRACDPSVGRKGLITRLAETLGEAPDRARVEQCLDELRRLKLILEIDNRILALAVPGEVPRIRRGFPGYVLVGGSRKLL